ncbi:MAG: M20/M25/M40 family metallo-hydrolase [Clostridia bacterium]|nr:M20/M25/M40 family metallo-hydrolase [Clostridia bacterium]
MPKFETSYYIPRLRKMINCKTVSVRNSFDPGEFMKLREVMRELFPVIHEKAEIKYFSEDCWVYKIEGKDKNKNFMLMSHHDVVGENGEWKYPAFGCEEHEGKIWGRGTVDTKTPLFCEFTAVEELLTEGFIPSCNLYIVSSHNEEFFGDGIHEAHKYFKEQGIKFDLILDEGGAIIEPPVDGVKASKCAMVAVHEKGRYYFTCEANTDSIYQDITKARKKNPVEKMTAFINEVNTSDIFIVRLNKQVRDMFTYIAPHINFPLNKIFSNLSLTGGLIKKIMPSLNPQARGLIGTTCTFTKIEGSSMDKKCTATAYFQPVSSEDFKKDLEAFTSLAKKYGISVTQRENCEFYEPADISSDGFLYTKKCIEEIFPENPVVPFILPAGTDARVFRDICPANLRFAPIKMSDKQLGLVHCPNENLDIPNILWAIRFYKHFVKNYS